MNEPNLFTLAADNNPRLLSLLRLNPSRASIQDSHGYSLLHAAVSYNHLGLLKCLVEEFDVNTNVKDEDGETPLFVVETMEAAQALLEELGADVTTTNAEGETAEDKILSDGEHPTIAAFLREFRLKNTSKQSELQAEDIVSNSPFAGDLRHPPTLPPNVVVNIGTTTEDESVQSIAEADPDFRQRIEELAARDDFQGEEGQRELRKLIEDAVKGVGIEENDRDVRRRIQ